jgi:glycosyltransferase involved in cell wall biosynthesis
MIANATFLHLTPLAEVGGCEVNCLRVIAELPRHQHHVLVFGKKGPLSEQWQDAGAEVEHLEAWEQGRENFERALSQWSEEQACPAGIFYWSTSRLPVVWRTLGHWPVPWVVYLGNPVSGGWRGRVLRWWTEQQSMPRTKLTLAACSSWVAASHRQAQFFRRLPIKVIYNSVAASFDAPREYRTLAAGSGPRVGMVARLDRIKDHATIIRAMTLLRNACPDLIVEFAGDGALRASLEFEARRHGVWDAVRFLGFVDVQPRLRAWDIYIHSTTAAEGMGTAVAEAMMAGLPCIVSDLAVMREVCGPEGAVYFPAGNAGVLAEKLMQLVENHARRKALGLAAQSRARELFAPDRVAAAYLELVTHA